MRSSATNTVARVYSLQRATISALLLGALAACPVMIATLSFAALRGGAEGLIPRAASPAPALVAKAVHTFTGEVVKVYDADTIWVETAKETRKIRLDRIDAPEAKQAWGKESTAAARALLLGKSVSVTWSSRDRYRRYLGIVTVDGADVAATLVRDGHAWVYVEYSKDPELLELEGEAKAAKRGLWSQPDPQAPWEYRREQRDHRIRADPARPRVLPRVLRARPLAPILPQRR